MLRASNGHLEIEGFNRSKAQTHVPMEDKSHTQTLQLMFNCLQVLQNIHISVQQHSIWPLFYVSHTLKSN